MVDRYFVLTDFAKKMFLQSKAGILPEKMVIKPNCAMPLLENAVTAGRGQYFLYVGRLSPEKGILAFLQTFKSLGFELMIVGRGPDCLEIEHIASENDHIRYLGFRDKNQIMQLMSGASALVVPSTCYEGMPMTILEAFSIGTPVLASDLGGLPEVVKPYETGFLFDIHDSASIVQTLSVWCQLDANEKDRISSNCLRFFQENFNPRVIVRQLLDVYSGLIEPNINR